MAHYEADSDDINAAAGYDSRDWLTNPAVLRMFSRVGTRETVDALAKAIFTEPEFDRFPVEPPDGTVLRYQKTFPSPPGKAYTYLALKADGRWYRTGRHNTPVDWPELRDDIANWPCHVATAWGEIPQAPESPFAGIDPADWFCEVYQNTVTVDADKEAKDS